MNYYIEDFTEANYKVVLETLINKGYKFLGFDYEKIISGKNIVVWRHDVDCSLNRSCKLAEIEANLGIKTTYFIHLQSSFYNVLKLRT